MTFTQPSVHFLTCADLIYRLKFLRPQVGSCGGGHGAVDGPRQHFDGAADEAESRCQNRALGVDATGELEIQRANMILFTSL